MVILSTFHARQCRCCLLAAGLAVPVFVSSGGVCGVWCGVYVAVVAGLVHGLGVAPEVEAVGRQSEAVEAVEEAEAPAVAASPSSAADDKTADDGGWPAVGDCGGGGGVIYYSMRCDQRSPACSTRSACWRCCGDSGYLRRLGRGKLIAFVAFAATARAQQLCARQSSPRCYLFFPRRTTSRQRRPVQLWTCSSALEPTPTRSWRHCPALATPCRRCMTAMSSWCAIAADVATAGRY